MADIMTAPAEENIHSGDQITGISPEEYMEKYAADFYEYVDGVVIKMSPVADIHDKLERFLLRWFEHYFEHRPVGEIRFSPFVMNIGSKREPDVQIILNENLERLKPTYMEGAADLAVEIVSLESTQRDYGEKFAEYEAAGVREYWIIDPTRHETNFYVLTDEKRFSRRQPDAEGIYTSTVLAELRLPVELLWQTPLPGPSAVAKHMSELLEG
ncbi:MAG TPA: Uma2 family endonuclease [Aggregatilineales bacterium]|nr:Uma2 family endonuclease [Aggregatilineales bacterium]